MTRSGGRQTTPNDAEGRPQRQGRSTDQTEEQGGEYDRFDDHLSALLDQLPDRRFGWARMPRRKSV